jgi:hypothetical protein
MFISKYISFKIFLISFVVGFFFVYLFGPERKEIVIYPSPENIEKIIYQDDAENCFHYEQEEVKCPSNSALIHSIPVQN